MDKDFEKRLNNLEKIYEKATAQQRLIIHTLSFINKAWNDCLNSENLKHVSNEAFFIVVTAFIVKEREKCFGSNKKVTEIKISFNDFVKIKIVAMNIIEELCKQNNYEGNYMDFREPICIDPTMLEDKI